MSYQTSLSSAYLEIIIGPMFSGKTSKLLEIYKQCNFCNIPVCVINYADDKRYHNEMLSTHDKVMIPCIQTTDLKQYIYSDYSSEELNKTGDFDKFDKVQEDTKKVCNSNVILINEAQFFGDLKDFVLTMLKMNKKIYLAGLDGDFKREKFGEILDLIPLCDKVTKLTSLCGICKDGTPGIFSLRLTDENQQKLIGSDNYIPVCRKCYT
uniref:thymidine kinase n=1 Tax=viral metagenome TaxID=1070528 RepID=A0A6C0KX02_9ZZZZ